MFLSVVKIVKTGSRAELNFSVQQKEILLQLGIDLPLLYGPKRNLEYEFMLWSCGSWYCVVGLVDINIFEENTVLITRVQTESVYSSEAFVCITMQIEFVRKITTWTFPSVRISNIIFQVF